MVRSKTSFLAILNVSDLNLTIQRIGRYQFVCAIPEYYFQCETCHAKFVMQNLKFFWLETCSLCDPRGNTLQHGPGRSIIKVPMC